MINELRNIIVRNISKDEFLKIMTKIDPILKDGNYHCDFCRWISIKSITCNRCGRGFIFE